MALKLGELTAVLKVDDQEFNRGLDQSEDNFRRHGDNLESDAEATAREIADVLADGGRKAGERLGDGIVRGADGRLRDARGRFTRLGNDLGADSGAGAAVSWIGRFGAKFGGMLPDAVSGAFSGLPPQVQAGVAAAAVVIGAVFATAAGAAITAGILLAVGGGVLAIGISQALKDPKVSAAWKGFGDRAQRALAGFVEPFKGPLIRAAGTFGAMIERMGPSLTRLGRTMAPLLDKLAPAFADGLEKALPGILAAAEASVPLFEKLAEHAPALGEAISKFFGFIAEGGPGATVFFDHLLTVLEFLIPLIGAQFAGLAKGYKATVDNVKAAKRWVVDTWNDVVGFFTRLPGRVSRAARGLWDGLKASFRSALNWIVGKWNGLSFRIPGVSVPGLGQVWGGATLNTPDLPYLAGGGTATKAGMAYIAERGKEAVYLPAGASVQPLGPGQTAAGSGPGHAEVRLTGEFRVRGSDLVLVLRDRVAVAGGNVQRVIGTDN